MLQFCYDVAFDNNVQVLETDSFDKTIDVKFGIYNSMLSIDLAPSDGKIDWRINLQFWKKKVKPYYAKADSKVRIHTGYISEWEKYRDSFFSIINNNSQLLEASKNGLVIAGRSKGGGEASIIAIDLVKNYTIPKECVFVGMLEAPKVGNKAYKQSVEKYISIEHLYWVRYKKDIVTMNPPFAYSPGNLIKFGKSIKPFSVIDHAIGCYDEEKMYNYAKEYDGGNE